MSGINPNLRVRAKANRPLAYYTDGLANQDRYILGECITLVESARHADQALRSQLLQYAAHKKQAARRVAITGSPGAGKSTMIEALGKAWVAHGHRVAVLAIDPSSGQSGGSILGDKTRMEQLSRLDGAFVRPTAAGKTLGGTAKHTKEAMTLCEAAGYDTIIVETVGVGQSETEVAGIVDIMLLLLLPGAGDDVQGIKRGIMEMADLLIINKADSDRIDLAQETLRSYRSAVSLLPRRHPAWRPSVLTASALNETGVDSILKRVEDFYRTLTAASIERLRQQQDSQWYRYQIERLIVDHFLQQPQHSQLVEDQQNLVLQAAVDPFTAVDQTMQQIFDI